MTCVTCGVVLPQLQGERNVPQPARARARAGEGVQDGGAVLAGLPRDAGEDDDDLE